MIKRDITETVYEYDNEGKLVKKTVTEKHEEEHPTKALNDFDTHNDWWKNTQITCDQVPTTYLSGGTTSVTTLRNNVKTTDGTING